MKKEPLYTARITDVRSDKGLQEWLCSHMAAMTEENLLEKGQIALELAVRDRRLSKIHDRAPSFQQLVDVGAGPWSASPNGRPIVLLRLCRCGHLTGAIDLERTDRAEAAQILGEWIVSGSTIVPVFSNTVTVTMSSCQCKVPA